MSTARRTPLYGVQQERGGRFVDFAGWHLPVQFAGIIAEHLAVRTAVGLFDVSHMGEIIIDGPGALGAVQYLVTNDISRLADGKAAYAFMCVEAGGIVDDLIVYRESCESFFLCVNAGRKDADLAHILAVAARFRCRVRDVSDAHAQLALQGPRAIELLSKLTSIELAALRPFCFADGEVAGIVTRVARTGYTGEDGVELYCESSRAEELWRAIELAGEGLGLVPCGLGARDTLRLEMKYPLYGSDIDLTHNPLEAGLGFAVKLDKGDFIGRAALAEVTAKGPARRWVGLKIIKGRNIARHGHVIYHEGAAQGAVTSGTFSPSLSLPIAVGYVPAAMASVGTEVEIDIRGQRVLATVVSTPFYVRGKT